MQHQYKIYFYTLEDHPLFTDLRTLLSLCTPFAETEPNGMFPSSFLEAFRHKISQPDPYYAEYLCRLALKLPLLEPLPAIGRRLVQPCKNFEAVLHMPTDQLWQRIVASALDLATEQFLDIFVHLDPQNPLALFWQALFQRMSVDGLVHGCFHLLHLDTQPDAPDEAFERDAFLSNVTLHVTVFLDRWLMAPFGQYLRLIKPLYYHHYHFCDELNFICDSLPIDHDASLEVFSLCFLFDHTPLGQAVFRPPQPLKDLQSMPPWLPLRDIWHAYRLSREKERFTEAEIDQLQQNTTIFTFQIQYADKPSFWKILQWPEDLTLEDLHQELSDLFDFAPDSEYCFIGANQEFSPNKKGRLRIRQSPQIPIKAIGLVTGDILRYRSAQPAAPELILQVLGCQGGRPLLRYPRLIDQSQELTEFERLQYES